MKAWELSKVLGIFRASVGEGTVLRLNLFCNIVAGGGAGVEQGALMRMGNIGRSTLSAALHDLSERNHLKAPGHGLIEIRADPENLRNNIVRLTPKGEALALEMFS